MQSLKMFGRFKSCSLRQAKACNGKPFSMLREQDNEMTYRFATQRFATVLLRSPEASPRDKSCSLRQAKACNGKPFSMLREQDNEMTYRFATQRFATVLLRSPEASPRDKSCSLRQKSPENVGFRGFFLCSEISLLFLTLNSDTKNFHETRKNGCFLPSNGIFPDTKFRH